MTFLEEAQKNGREIKHCPICDDLVIFAHAGGDAFNATGPSPKGTITLSCRCSMPQKDWDAAKTHVP